MKVPIQKLYPTTFQNVNLCKFETSDRDHAGKTQIRCDRDIRVPRTTFFDEQKTLNFFGQKLLQ